MVREFVEGARAVKEVKGLAALTWLVVAVLFAFGIEQVVQVLVVRERLDLDADAVGVLIACTGIGGLLAVPFSARLAAHRNAGRLLAISGLLMGAPLALLAVTNSLAVAGALMVVEGVGNIFLDVLAITLLQRVCPDRLLGRVFSLQDTSGSLAQLVGTDQRAGAHQPRRPRVRARRRRRIALRRIAAVAAGPASDFHSHRGRTGSPRSDRGRARRAGNSG